MERQKVISRLKLIDKEDITKENISFDIKQNETTNVPKSNYIYHTFNQDYVEENIRALSFEKDSNIQGFILGKTQIDLAEDETKLNKLKESEANLRYTIEENLKVYLSTKITPIRDITRLQEYKDYLNIEAILKSNEGNKINNLKTTDEYIIDYNKIKSVPEALDDIRNISNIYIDLELLSTIATDLEKPYDLSSLAEDFKKKVREKQSFIEQGIGLLNTNKSECVFLWSTNDNYSKRINK